MNSVLTIDQPAYFDRLADVEARHWWSLGMWRLASYWLDSALNGRTALTALDVGAGTGLTTLRLSRRPEIALAVGVEPSPEALAHARMRHDVPLVRGSALALPFSDGPFDVLTCFDVLQHLPDPVAVRLAVSEIRRVLVPGGVVLVRSNGRGWSGDRSTYRLSDLIDLFNHSGFVVQRASHANALPAMAQELRGLLSRGGRRGHPCGGGLQIRVPHPTVNAALRHVSGFEAWLAGRVGFRLPFGHSTLVLASREG